MEAIASVVSRRRYEQHVLFGAGLDRFCEHRFSVAGGHELPAADVDDMGAGFNCLENGSGQIELRAQ